jgi:hypothetical protein
MGLLICSCCVLALFFLRDVFILGSKQKHFLGKLLLYIILMSLYLEAAMRIAYSLPQQRALNLLSAPFVWTGVLAMHLGLWRFAAWMKRVPHGKGRMWLTVIAPAPMFLLSAIVVSHRIVGVVDSSGVLTAGLIASAIWTMLVLAGVLAFRLVYCGWEDWDCVADVVAITSWTGIGILPFAGVFQWMQVLLNYD